MSKPKKSAYLLIAHGTREKKGEEAFFEFAAEFQRSFPDRKIQPAFLELSRPSIPEGIDSCVKEGVEEIFVLPLMLFPGRHVNQDIPREIQEAKHRHPHVDFHYAGALALQSSAARRSADARISEPKMFELLSKKIAGLELREGD